MSQPSPPTPEEQDQFFAALGRAITDWAYLEQELFEITAKILGCTRERAAIVFYRTPTIESRITLTRDLVYSALPGHRPGEQPHPSVTIWEELQGDIKDNLSIRNRLAHHSVTHVVDIYQSEDGKEHKIEIRQASYISQTEHLRKGGQPLEALGIEEIEAHIRVVHFLINRLRNFRAHELLAQLSRPVD
jgi:hypothetical protein